MIKILMPTMMITMVGGLWGTLGAGVAIIFAAAYLVMWGIIQWSYVCVPELETAVVYRANSKTFIRFLAPGHYWIIPFVEQVGEVIPLSPGTTKGQCLNIETGSGIPLTIDWALSYKLNPFRIPPINRPKLARSLPKRAGTIARNHVNNCIRHVISDYSVEALSQPGMIKRLEREVHQLAASRLTDLGFEISRVMLGIIEMPSQVRAALAGAYEQQVRTEHEARSLARLQQVVSQFSEIDMARLMELERIYKLGQNGVMMMYQTAAVQTSPTPPMPANFGHRYSRPPQVNMASTEVTTSGLS